MGIAAILLAQDSPWVLYVDEDSHMVLAAHKEDAPKGVSTFYRLPKERVPLNKNGTLTIERAQLDKLISTWPGQKGRKAPHTLKERLRQAFPAVVIWLGLLSLLVGVSTFFTKFKTPFRALVLVVLMLMFGFGAIKGALGFAGLDALSAHQRSPAVIDLFKAFQ